MLVLTRKQGEAFTCVFSTDVLKQLMAEYPQGFSVVVHTQKTQGSRVQVGVEAPPLVPCYRNELLAQIQQQELQTGVTLEEWLEGWEAEVEAGQSHISRDEAIRRWKRNARFEEAAST